MRSHIKISSGKKDNIKIAEVRSAGKYMNGNAEERDPQKYAIDKDIFNLMMSWLRDKSTVPSVD